MCNFNVDFSKIFWGTPILGRGYGAPPQTPPPRRSGASRLRASLGTFGPSIVVIHPLQKSWLRAWTAPKCAFRDGKKLKKYGNPPQCGGDIPTPYSRCLWYPHFQSQVLCKRNELGCLDLTTDSHRKMGNTALSQHNTRTTKADKL